MIVGAAAGVLALAAGFFGLPRTGQPRVEPLPEEKVAAQDPVAPMPVAVVPVAVVPAPAAEAPSPAPANLPSAKAPPMLRISQRTVHEHVSKLRKRLTRTTPKGEEPDAMATMLIKNAEKNARAARGEPELKRVEQTLADIERKYFRP